MRFAHGLRHPASGALELLKLAGLAAMVVDHANKYGLDGAYPAMEHVGRLAFPLFALVVAANLRWHTADAQRYFMRLAVWGLASQPVYVWTTGRPELNILLTLAVGVQLVLALDAAAQRAGLDNVVWLLVVLAAAVPCDYRLTGPLLVAVFHAWFSQPRALTAALVVLCVAVLNASLAFAPATLASLGVAAIVAGWRPEMPRMTRYWFYPFYPLHFAVIRWIAAMSPS